MSEEEENRGCQK
jgi:hypothetical protein